VLLMDVDTGVDDALAIMLALHAPNREFVGVTTVSGNTSSTQAAVNTRFLFEQICPRRLPQIVTGAATALNGRTPTPVPEIHGSDGLGGIVPAGFKTADLQAASGDAAARFIVDAARQHGERLAIVATGPLTNLALALRLDRAALARAGVIAVMGGALFSAGNVTPYAEFNAYCDPEAFREVMTSGPPIRLFPLDVTERVRLMADTLEQDLGISESKRNLIRSMSRVYMTFHARRDGFHGAYVHDAMPVAWLIEPDLFEFQRGHVDVTLSGEQRRQTIWHETPSGNIEAAFGVHESRFLDLFWSCLRREPSEQR